MCAQFNPPVGDVKGINPLGWSHSADVPSSFASTLATSIKGVGDMLGLTAKAGDELVKQDASRAVEDEIRPEQEAYISALTSGKEYLKGLATPDASPEATAQITQGSFDDLSTTKTEELPSGLKEFPRTLGTLEGARANGKISETDYYSRLMSITKDLRSRYPVGYRDYIDKEVSKITGVDPANAYIHSIIGDINAGITNQQAERTKVLAEVMKTIPLSPSAPAAYENLRTGKWTNKQALDFVQPLLAEEANHQRLMRKVQEQEVGTKYQEQSAEQAFRTFASDRVASTQSGTIQTQGLTPDKIKQAMVNAYEGKTNLTGEQMYAYANQMKAFMEQDRAAMIKELNFVDTNPNSPTYRPIPLSSMLKDKSTKIIDEALYGHQQVIDAFIKKDIGLVFNSQKIVESMKDDDALIYWKSPPDAPGKPTARMVFSQLNLLKTNGGDNAVAQAWSRVVSHGLPDLNSTALQTKIANLATAPDPRGPDFKTVNNLGEAISRTADEEKKTGIKQSSTFKEIQNMIDGPKLSLLDPATRPEVKRAIANNFFGPENIGVLRRIKPDVRDERGNLVPGQESWFKRFTSPEVVQEINRLDDVTKANYKNWVQATYEDIAKQSIENLKVMNITGAKVVGWDDGTHRPDGQPGFIVTEAPRDRTDVTKRNYDYPATSRDVRNPIGTLRDPVQETVTSMNKAISGLANVYKGQGLSTSDVEVKILETLNFERQRFGQIQGIPKQFLDALEVRHKKMEEERIAEEAKKKATEQKYKP